MANYDLETAKAMLKTKRYLYVGFMCNQVIEKILKAYFVKIKKVQPPYTHKLRRLAEECNLYKNEMNENQKLFLDKLAPLNIEARYPSEKQRMFEMINNEKLCSSILKETEEFVKWIEKKLEN